MGCLLLALPWSVAGLEQVGWLLLLLLTVYGWLRSRGILLRLQWLAAGLIGGLLFALLHVLTALQARVPLCADQDYRQLTVLIDSRVAYSTGVDQRRVARFAGRLLEAYRSDECRIDADSRIRLSWYDPPVLGRGQTWDMLVRVRPAWSFRNPGGFDYERWLFSNQLQGTGYVRSAELLEEAAAVATGAFARWLDSTGIRHVGLVLALVNGDASRLTDRQWDWFRDSGTIHLMVVSGLHVGLVTGVCYFLSLWLLRLLPLRPKARQPLLAALPALLVAALFVLSTGSGVPAVRAWIMAAVVLVAVSSGWRLATSLVVLLSLLAVLLVEPLAVHQRGFYLSFGAVAVLLGYFSSHPGGSGVVRTGLTLQLVLYLFMVPLLALQQSELPLAGSLVNLLAVPMLTIILPLLLLCSGLWWLHSDLAGTLLQVADQLLDWLLLVVRAGAAAGTVSNGSGGLWPIAVALLAALLLCCGLTWRFRLLLTFGWLVWLLPASSRVPAGEFRVVALDVGQGSAVLIDTQHHRLLFDAGPAYPGGFDLGEAAVLPALLRTGPLDLDALVLSHQDLDHTGGSRAVLDQVAVERIFASFQPGGLKPESGTLRPCSNQARWIWDGVEFLFLTTEHTAGASDNDRSCVLRIASHNQVVVIAGDISSRVERRVVREHTELLAADLVFAPHHGSNSSSSRQWIEAAAPRLVFISAPRRSRYGHPHPQVMARYLRAGAEVFVTGRSGALWWRSWQPEQVTHQRGQNPPYWVNPRAAGLARVRPSG